MSTSGVFPPLAGKAQDSEVTESNIANAQVVPLIKLLDTYSDPSVDTKTGTIVRQINGSSPLKGRPPTSNAQKPGQPKPSIRKSHSHPENNILETENGVIFLNSDKNGIQGPFKINYNVTQSMEDVSKLISPREGDNQIRLRTAPGMKRNNNMDNTKSYRKSMTSEGSRSNKKNNNSPPEVAIF